MSLRFSSFIDTSTSHGAVRLQVTTTEPRGATTVHVQLPAGLEAVSPASLAAFPEIRRLDSPRPPNPAEGDDFRIEQPVCFRPWYLRPDFVPDGEPGDYEFFEFYGYGLGEIEELTDEQRAMDQPCPSLALVPGGAVFTVPSLSAGTHELTLLALAAFPGAYLHCRARLANGGRALHRVTHAMSHVLPPSET